MKVSGTVLLCMVCTHLCIYTTTYNILIYRLNLQLRFYLYTWITRALIMGLTIITANTSYRKTQPSTTIWSYVSRLIYSVHNVVQIIRSHQVCSIYGNIHMYDSYQLTTNYKNANRLATRCQSYKLYLFILLQPWTNTNPTCICMTWQIQNAIIGIICVCIPLQQQNPYIWIWF